jgi:type IX secretion system PorP/SprF family membrane protein
MISVSKSFIISILLIICLGIKAQDPHFTQFYANKLFLSPSFAGATPQNRFILNYRNQWPSVHAYQTGAVSYDHFFSNFNSGLGFMVLKDIAGDGNLGITQLGLYYSYDFSVNEMIHLRPGLNLSYLQRSIDYSKLTFSDQYSSSGFSTTPREAMTGKDRVGAIDAAVSGILYAQDWWIGITTDHLMRPNVSLMGNEDRMPIKYSLFGGYTLIRRGRLLKPVDETVSLAFLLKGMKKNLQTDIGVYWAQMPLVLGLWYRGIPVLNSERGDAFALLLGLKTRTHWNIGYSYDFTISNLVNHTSGSHEISLTYEFYKARRKKMHAVPCPEF